MVHSPFSPPRLFPPWPSFRYLHLHRVDYLFLRPSFFALANPLFCQTNTPEGPVEFSGGLTRNVPIYSFKEHFFFFSPPFRSLLPLFAILIGSASPECMIFFLILFYAHYVDTLPAPLVPRKTL